MKNWKQILAWALFMAILFGGVAWLYFVKDSDSTGMIIAATLFGGLCIGILALIVMGLLVSLWTWITDNL